MRQKARVAVVGGSGYTGAELIRLLLPHPGVDLRCVTSRAQAGVALATVFPNLRGQTDLCYTAPDVAILRSMDLVFFATPNGVAMQQAPELLAAGVRVVDLAADFRLRDAALWQHWYDMPHACPDYLNQAVYGLPERNRAAIAKARLVANPGCYPTAVQLGLLPLLEQQLVQTDSLIADVKSGASGAGRQPSMRLLHTEVSGNLNAYAAGGHRHQPEIEQELAELATEPVRLTFVPHLLPTARGIHATLYARLRQPEAALDVQQLYESRYADEPFVDVLPAGEHPRTHSVAGQNLCRMAVWRPGAGDTVVVLSVIDNLIKGAAGQAVQNMNLMLDFEEETGLAHLQSLC